MVNPAFRRCPALAYWYGSLNLIQRSTELLNAPAPPFSTRDPWAAQPLDVVSGEGVWVPEEQRDLGLLELADPTGQAVSCEISSVAHRKKHASSQFLASLLIFVFPSA